MTALYLLLRFALPTPNNLQTFAQAKAYLLSKSLAPGVHYCFYFVDFIAVFIFRAD